MVENKGRNEPEPIKPSYGSFREWVLERSELLLGAYFSALVVLAYPASLVTLWIQLASYYRFEYWTALYAASSVPITLVVGKVVLIALYSLLANVAVWNLCLFVFGYRPLHKAIYNTSGNPYGLEHPDEQTNRRETTVGQLWFWSQRILAIIAVFVVIPSLVLPSSIFASWFELGIYLAYLLLVFLGAYISVPVVVASMEMDSRHKFYQGVAVVFAVSILAAVPLAGSGSPSLPTVEMNLSGQKQTVAVLSHSDGYWHVINQNEDIVHIPADEVEGVVRVNGIAEKPDS